MGRSRAHGRGDPADDPRVLLNRRRASAWSGSARPGALRVAQEPAVYQSLVAALRCPACARLSPEDESTGIQVGELPWDGEPPLVVRVGDRFRGGFRALLAAGFREVKPPVAGEAARLLVDWECPHCAAAALWAVAGVRSEGGVSVLASLEAARTMETLRSVHATSGLLVDVIAFGEADFVAAVAASLAHG